MRLSRTSDHALRAVYHLSTLPKNRLASITTIARAESLPREFLAKILNKLVSSGILVSIQGSNGGYHLARPARGVSFLDVIEAVEGPLHLSLCTEPEKCSCKRDDYLHRFWVTLERVTKNTLNRKHFGS